MSESLSQASIPDSVARLYAEQTITVITLRAKVAELTPLLANAIRERNKYDAECDRLEAKVAELRKLIMAAGINLGCLLADGVSDEFLSYLPEEARLVRAKVSELERENEKLRELILELEPDADINELLEVE